jgi:hypothetical protein
MKAMGSHIRHKAIQVRDVIMMCIAGLPSMKSCLVGNRVSSIGRRRAERPLHMIVSRSEKIKTAMKGQLRRQKRRLGEDNVMS